MYILSYIYLYILLLIVNVFHNLNVGLWDSCFHICLPKHFWICTYSFVFYRFMSLCLIFCSILYIFFLFFKNYYLFIYLFLAVLGLRFCARAFSSCGERGPLFIAVRRPLTIVASLVAEHRLQTRRLSSCGSRA